MTADVAVQASAALAQAHLVVAVMAFHFDFGFRELCGEIVAQQYGCGFIAAGNDSGFD